MPVFQRPYIWTQDQQWEPLWEDIDYLAGSVLESGEANPHFLGAVVLQQVPNRVADIETRLVVDGQQRLTTIQLLLGTLHEVCAENGYSIPAARLGALVQNPDEYVNGDSNLKLKVWPTEFDQNAFQRVMKNDSGKEYTRNNRIVLAHEYFKEQVRQWLE